MKDYCKSDYRFKKGVGESLIGLEFKCELLMEKLKEDLISNNFPKFISELDLKINLIYYDRYLPEYRKTKIKK